MRAHALAGAFMLLLALAAPAFADETAARLADADRGAIRAVIQDQIAAFRRDDGPAAFAFASPGIQHQFGDPATFLDLVRRAYQPVYRPGAFAFGALVELDGHTVQKVDLIGPDGARQTALYFMEHEPDGTWRIDGCMLEQSDSVGA